MIRAEKQSISIISGVVLIPGSVVHSFLNFILRLFKTICNSPGFATLLVSLGGGLHSLSVF